ncbi:hypothetical protein BX659_10295 [Orenia metallireducens]|jgi:type II secretory pathway component PulK|uniref:Type II secretory pathway, pseudopilin PulG n=1 Tax=Orenia metallireducens TaxID=1413210 RepID=A0A285F2T2_9FIRM|nr:hypothetical protein [Orenia metallireducens]PRX34780.1 hypothetical protein BX659_10295 [Orenia metallireducens]SNY05598.1 hypothetical protein SAMN06265827_10195 [Orenia metallireducens]
MLKQQEGAITIFVLSIFLALMVLIGGVIEVLNSQFALLEKKEDSLQALYLAESGIEQARVKIKAGEIDSFRQEVIVNGRYNGSYEVTITIEGDKNQVISTGNFQGRKKVLKRIISN